MGCGTLVEGCGEFKQSPALTDWPAGPPISWALGWGGHDWYSQSVDLELELVVVD